jgi:hypothetical protein
MAVSASLMALSTVRSISSGCSRASSATFGRHSMAWSTSTGVDLAAQILGTARDDVSAAAVCIKSVCGFFGALRLRDLTPARQPRFIFPARRRRFLLTTRSAHYNSTRKRVWNKRRNVRLNCNYHTDTCIPVLSAAAAPFKTYVTNDALCN